MQAGAHKESLRKDPKLDLALQKEAKKLETQLTKHVSSRGNLLGSGRELKEWGSW